VDLNKLTPEEDARGEDARETEELREMLQEALEYLRRHSWCPEILESYMGIGIGGVLAVFLVHLSEKVGGTDDWLWVIEGDLPSAYPVTDAAPDARTALAGYCEIMEDWAEAVLSNGPLDDVFPVAALAGREHAETLLSRTQFIREKVLPSRTSGQ
jgi:hypothetical protein